VVFVFDGLAPEIGARAGAAAEVLQIFFELGELALALPLEIAFELLAQNVIALAALLAERGELGLHGRAATSSEVFDLEILADLMARAVRIGDLAQDAELGELAQHDVNRLRTLVQELGDLADARRARVAVRQNAHGGDDDVGLFPSGAYFLGHRR